MLTAFNLKHYEKVTNTELNPNTEWLLGGNPNAIENQEAQGQKELVNSSQLPTNSNIRGIDAKEQYEKMGIKVNSTTDNDDIFFDVEMPKGWKKEATDHSMWNNLIDNNGRKRAMIFYKAAFYDRSSHIDFMTRYSIEGNFEIEGKLSYQAKDNEEVLFETKQIERRDYGKHDALRLECENFLNNKYPKFKDINEYWD